MDWPTIIGLILSAIGTADLAYKYGSVLFKKIHSRTRAGKSDTLLKKSRSRYRALKMTDLKKVQRAITSEPLIVAFSGHGVHGLLTTNLKKNFSNLK